MGRLAGLAKISRILRRNRPAGKIKNWARETASGSLIMGITLNCEKRKAWLHTKRPDEAVKETVSKVHEIHLKGYKYDRKTSCISTFITFYTE